MNRIILMLCALLSACGATEKHPAVLLNGVDNYTNSTSKALFKFEDIPCFGNAKVTDKFVVINSVSCNGELNTMAGSDRIEISQLQHPLPAGTKIVFDIYGMNKFQK